MITTKHVPPVAPGSIPGSQIHNIYNMIVDNIKQSCDPTQHQLILDNTYQSLDSVCETVSQTQNDVDLYIILNLIDPPFTWHYLKQILNERFPNSKFCFVGSDAPDIDIQYWFIYARNILTRYTDQEIMPQSFDHVFLSYNRMLHYHRTELIARMKEQDLLKFGIWSLNAKIPNEHPAGWTSNLGPLSNWNTSFLNIVSETVFRLSTEPLLITEKIFKPIFGLRPWIVNGSPKYYYYYKKHGFDCFEDIFPVAELSQDAETLEATVAKNHKLICDVVQDLTKENLQKLYQKLLPRLIANREQALTVAADYENRYCNQPIALVSSTGIEPVTSTVSR